MGSLLLIKRENNILNAPTRRNPYIGERIQCDAAVCIIVLKTMFAYTLFE